MRIRFSRFSLRETLVALFAVVVLAASWLQTSYAQQVVDGITWLSTGRLFLSTTTPTLVSGVASGSWGTSPSVVASNGVGAFTIDVGSGGSATTGQITLPTATTGWNCFAIDRTTNIVTRQTSTTTTVVTLTGASAWGANNVLQVSCFAY